MGALAYLVGPVTGVIFLLVEKENKFIRFHAMQSTIALGGLWVLLVVLGFIPFFGFISIFLWPLNFILWIVLMVMAFQGKMFKLPVVGEMAAKKVGA